MLTVLVRGASALPGRLVVQEARGAGEEAADAAPGAAVAADATVGRADARAVVLAPEEDRVAKLRVRAGQEVLQLGHVHTAIVPLPAVGTARAKKGCVR